VDHMNKTLKQLVGSTLLEEREKWRIFVHRSIAEVTPTTCTRITTLNVTVPGEGRCIQHERRLPTVVCW
jgi:hypothetical protein